MSQTAYRLVVGALVAFVYAPSALAQSEPTFAPAPCPFEIEEPSTHGVECGRVTVRENRDHSDGRTLDLSVVLLRSTAEQPRPDPVIFVSGGPGSPVTTRGNAYIDSRIVNEIREQRDFILWDQRGTGASEPALCPDLEAALLRSRYGAESEAHRIRMATGAVRACRQRINSAGIDVSAINSAISARDLADVREALGYPEWNLLGVSYGTRVVLTALRDVPKGIRSVVLDGTFPLHLGNEGLRPQGLARSIGLVFRQCEADPACTAEFPDLEAELFATLDELDEAPLELPLNDPVLFPEGHLGVDGRTFALGVYQALYSSRTIPFVPLLVREVRNRNDALLTAMVRAMAPTPETESPFMSLSVSCHEWIPNQSATRKREVAAKHPRLARLDDDVFESVCPLWHDSRADPALLLPPVVSDVPALLLSGEFDPATPPRWAQVVAEHLTSAEHLVLRGLGHGVTPYTACGRGLVLSFLDAPRAPLDTACVDELPAMKFETDVAISKGMAFLSSRLAGGPGWGLLIWCGSALLLLFSAVVVWPMSWLVRRLRGRSVSEKGLEKVRSLVGATASTTLVFVGGLVAVVATTPNRFTLTFGIPDSTAPLLWLPWVILGLTVVSVIAVVRAWRNDHTSRLARIHVGLVAGAAVSFTALLGWLGFFSA